MYLSLSQAAKETGISKATISRALKNGRLSYVEKTDRGYKIDPAELFRVFPMESVGTGSVKQYETPETVSLVQSLESRIQEQLRTIEDLRARLDRSEDERQALNLRLENQTKPKRFLGIF